MVVEKRNATQINPPARRRDSSAVGSKAKLKMTTTSSAKKSMELRTSRDRHSRRKSFPKLAAASLKTEGLMRFPAARRCARPDGQPRARQTRQPFCRDDPADV